MISYLRGRVARLSASEVVIDVAGIGYKVFIGPNTANKLAQEQDVLVHTAQIIREDSTSLYGFLELEELDLFNLLGTVNGVGPKSALAIVNQLGISGISQAVATADDSVFRSVSGIGPKTAKLIILSLTGKMSMDSGEPSLVNTSIIQALVNLGYQERVARSAVASAASLVPTASDSDLLKAALAELSNNKASK